MNDPAVFFNPCALCKKRESTKLCDYIVKYDNSVIFFREPKLFHEVNQPNYKHETCDLPMCEDCSKNVGNQVDFCPQHHKLHLQIELPKELQAYQRKAKAKMYEDAILGRDTHKEGDQNE